MADILALKGRVLFLSEDPALIEAQLAGRELSRAEAGKLRDDVSDVVLNRRKMHLFDPQTQEAIL